MIRIGVALGAILGLAACGGGARYSSSNALQYSDVVYAPSVVAFATGPIERACRASGRTAASQARCGCVQAVADRSLSPGDQRRGAAYFKDPHALQEVRQSDTANHERFWLAWKAFGQTAESICSAV